MRESELRELITTMFLGGDTSLPIGADTQLLEEGICDSLGLVQMATELERRCPGVRIRDQEVTRENFGSISAILRFLAGKTQP